MKKGFLVLSSWFLVLCLFATGCGGDTGTNAGGAGGAGGDDDGGSSASARDFSGTIATIITSLSLPKSFQKDLISSCTGVSLCCYNYEGSTPVVASLADDCSFTVSLPLQDYFFCGAFSGTDGDSDDCPDTLEGYLDEGIYISLAADGSSDAIDAGTINDDDDDGIYDVPEAVRTALDADGDGTSDATDDDDDGDGFADVEDTFFAGLLLNGLQVDGDGDGVPDIFELAEVFADCLDADEDAICNIFEEDPDDDDLIGDDDTDSDGDGIADAEDDDADGDGIDDAGAEDADGDGVIDSYDWDADGDGVANDDEVEGGVGENIGGTYLYNDSIMSDCAFVVESSLVIGDLISGIAYTMTVGSLSATSISFELATNTCLFSVPDFEASDGTCTCYTVDMLDPAMPILYGACDRGTPDETADDCDFLFDKIVQ